MATQDLLPKVKKNVKTMYVHYALEVAYRDRCLGQVNEDIDARMAKVEALVRKGKMPRETADRIWAETRERYLDMEKAMENGEPAEGDGADEAEKGNRHIFWRDDKGLYLESRIVKSALKDILSMLQIFVAKKGSKTVHNLGLFVENEDGGDRLYFRNADGTYVQDGDGDHTMPIHIYTGNEFKAAITVNEYLEKKRLPFKIKLVKDAKLKEPDLLKALAILEDAGLGGKRSQGFGKVDLVRCERL